MMRRILTLLCAALALSSLAALVGCSHDADDANLPHDSSRTYKAPMTPIGAPDVTDANGKKVHGGVAPPPP